MATAAVSLNTKISPEEKAEFTRTAEALGLTPSAAIKIFVRMFNDCGGFPFEVRRQDRTEGVLRLDASQFDAFAKALDAPMPAEAQALISRDFEWAE